MVTDNRDEDSEKFEQFLFEMDDVLDNFVVEAARADCVLDFTLDSLGDLERFLTVNLERGNAFDNRAARYLGEVFRKAIGGKWELCLKNPRYMFFGLPVISGYSTHPIEFCPIHIVENFKTRQEPGMLLQAVNAHEEFRA